MELNKILDDMSNEVGRNATYLKGLYNKNISELSEQFADTLTEDRLMVLALTKIGKKYGMSNSAIGITINGEPEPEDLEFLEDDTELDGLLDEAMQATIDEIEAEPEVMINIYDDADDLPNPTENTWDSVMADVADPLAKAKEGGKFEKTPSLIIEIGPTYYLKVDLSEPPFPYPSEGKYGPQVNTVFKVWLQKVSDTDLYSVKYKKGDFAGQLAFVDGKRYSLWMDEKCIGYFKLFWMRHRGLPTPDDRIFTFKHSKKGIYNVWQFGIPK
ncbi:hypothetical protein LCGC14_1094400 [marine sediment metagenome]|uniref:Uncharacterized protein n=1 Tax=marine sediment metagenome TaxID=412755 RepID=A0A0F9PUF9_9ZZZZ